MRILLVEDDEVLLDVLQRSLSGQQYVIDAVEDGITAWDYVQSVGYDLIVMDVGLPKLDGISLCQRLRSKGCTVPILLITAQDASRDRIRGLDAGADDYLTKPLDLGELQARVRALLRRGEVAHTSTLQVGNLCLDPAACQVRYCDRLLTLTPKEYSLLELFLRNPERVFSRGQIIEHLWTMDDPPLEESVKAHIKGLRQKLKAAGAVDWIENVYGLGYRLQPKLEPISVASTPPPAVEEQFNQAKEQLWDHYQDLMRQRLAILQAIVTAVEQDSLSPKLRQEAQQAAHKLAGVLGMFDRDHGTAIARELEQLLVGDQTLSSTQAQSIPALVQQLHDLLNSPATAPAIPAAINRPEKGPEKSTRSPAPKAQPEPSSLAASVNVLVVDDDPLFLAALHPMLEPWGIRLTSLSDPAHFWNLLPSVAPDLLILDVEMPQQSGVELCRAIRSHADWQSLPILFLTAHCDRDTLQQVFSAGADDYVTKPIVGPELLTRITQRLERLRLLQTLSTKDPLTGLANQFQSSQALERLLQQTLSRTEDAFCLVLLTITNLRLINIQYGHSTGNQVLQQWGNLLRTAFPHAKGLGYWGNGEFVAEMPGPKTAVRDRLSQVLQTLRQQIFTTPDGQRFQASFSLGVAEYPSDGATLQLLYQIANDRSTQGVSDG